MFCLWEAQPGKDTASMQEHMDTWTNTFTNFTNYVMLIPSKLSGYPPFHIKPFFGGNVARRLQSSAQSTSKLYLIQHTFKDEGAHGSFWDAISATWSDQDKVKQMVANQTAQGFYNHLFLPTGNEGPIFCLWEAQLVKTNSDMQNFIDAWVKPLANFTNVVMPIALELVGGFPTGLTPFFSSEGHL